ncbi:MAG: hypothetical protein ACPGJS_14400, partial [Flammeovirgaceae bacterium]
GPFDKVVYYEKPLLKKLRQFYAGQYGLAMSYTEMPQWHLDHFNIKKVDLGLSKDLKPKSTVKVF